MKPNSLRVVFFHVRDLTSKLNKIIQAANYHFERKEHFLIQVADEKALSFLDDLLWKMPIDSFLPHFIAENPQKDFVVITNKKHNLNRAKYVFNLCPTPLLYEENYQIIYELEDLTTPNKRMLSQKRFQAYKQAEYIIESR